MRWHSSRPLAALSSATGTGSLTLMVQLLLLAMLLAMLSSSVHALRFDLHATAGQGTQKCVEQYVHKDTLVTGAVDIPARENQRIDAEIIDDTASHNKHWSKPNVVGEHKFSFTVHQDAYLRFCFTGTLPNGGIPGPDVKRPVYLRIDVGADAKQVVIDKEKEKLQPIWTELTRLDGIAREVVADMEYLEGRDDYMHDVNLSTRDRVVNLSTFTMVVLISVGGWQIWYLHSYFKAKQLI
ncbi:hypothetical protein BASA50_010596 [Batrachochytrium salamandrivorans]|uniref:GOLD domain-containing protein n=1 Tax=Batrachochytrium salamandrivorans TaxID=1357716 RepID=A0ABQ8EY39_9FUNG|nr:hypothetical protein BASA62_001743 [Batrachochytrium salamandrivorans]KAH6588635.1 hypothetical protein BASA50_010596 [Batrachochytrium salamandrivorans]KAH6602298.1 hypothetical protein BASA61_001251 [Batrachochytrium salamandrivorans]